MRLTIPIGGAPRRLAAWAALAVALGGCDGGRSTAERTIFSFAQAVQNEDLDALFCALAGAAQPVGGADEAQARRLAFDAWVRSRLGEYAVGRDRGVVDLGDDGIVLVKAFALAKGTYYDVRGTQRSGDTLMATTAVRFAYDDIDISGFPPGTTLYVCAAPPGRIERLRIPREGRAVEAEVLETIGVQWTFRREGPAGPCGDRWTVASVTPLPGTETTREITWTF